MPVAAARCRAGRNGPLASARADGDTLCIDEAVITRDEVVALLFNVSDIVASLTRIERQLEEDDGEEADEG